jgi:tetratricopeptide (TPR) repeat protein
MSLVQKIQKRHRQDVALVSVIFIALIAIVTSSRWLDSHRPPIDPRFEEEKLYLSGNTAKRLSLGFSGIASDYYWMRSLQYLGRKLVNFEDSSTQQLSLNDLSVLELHLLPSLLRVSTSLDPEFMGPYELGAMILPTFNTEEAVTLLNYGIEHNPNVWQLYQHLGYIYWQQHDYHKSSEIYGKGAKIVGAPEWMAEMSARVAAEGGSRNAARDMYRHLYEESKDEQVKELIGRRLMQVESFDERDAIRAALKDYQTRTGRCVSSWKDISQALRASRLRIDVQTGAPVDPSDTPYVLVKNGCDVDLDYPRSRVPYR